MLYCPKCRSKYEEGTQRFCSNDGGRLLPVPPAQKANTQVTGVFTSILGKMQNPDGKNKEDLASTTKSIASKTPEKPANGIVPKAPLNEKTLKTEIESSPKSEPAKIFEDDEDSLLELEPQTPVSVNKPPVNSESVSQQPPLSVIELARQDEILSSIALAEECQTSPSDRTALSRDNSEALIGQTVKGRYFVKEKLQENQKSLVFLAEDKTAANRNVVLLVLIGENDSATNLINERVSLLHLNHPNIASVFDSGELPECGKFIVSEFVEGKSLKEMLRESGQFNTKRAARIIRQVSYALSEAHQNGILHRNLKPENIVLTVSEEGIEQVKLVNFGLLITDLSDEALLYKSPEEIRGEPPTFASEIFSLAAIGYEMLTKRLPFNAFSPKELLKLQKEGLTIPPTTLRIDVPPLADKVLEKALAFEPSGRYQKARDFGDAFFNALTTVSPWEVEEKKDEKIEVTGDRAKKDSQSLAEQAIESGKKTEISISSDIHIASKAPKASPLTEEFQKAPVVEEQIWERRSVELPRANNWIRSILPILGALLLLFGLWGIWKFLSGRTVDLPDAGNSGVSENVSSGNVQDNVLPVQNEVDRPPQPRNQKQPPDTNRFINNPESLKGDLAKNFLGFEIFYPQDWEKADNDTNFIDISRKNDEGYPLEQMLITYYKSRGTMTLDRENFPKLAEKSNNDLRKIIGDSYKVLGSGETAIQNGRWKGYEVKFQGLLPDGKTIIWGRRLWIPVQSPGVQNGFVITMLATSLSGKVKSVEDVGTKGELAEILESFEPEQTF
jgi:serine/threonine protein kinase